MTKPDELDKLVGRRLIYIIGILGAVQPADQFFGAADEGGFARLPEGG